MLQKSPIFISRLKNFLIFLIILFSIVYGGMAFFPKSQKINIIFSTTLVSMSCITAIVLLLFSKLIYKIDKKFYTPWFFIGLAYLSFAIGDILSHIFNIPVAGKPFSILVNLFYIIFYPLFFMGIVNFPFASMSKKQRINLFLELAVILLSMGIILWNLFVKPYIKEGKLSSLITVLIVAAPVCDAALLWFILKLNFKKKSPLLGKSYLFMALGIFMLLLSDTAFLYIVIIGKEIWSLFAFLGYPLSQMLIILSGVEFIYTLKEKEIIDEPMKRESYSFASIIIAYSSFFTAFIILFLNLKEKEDLSFFIFIPLIVLLGFLRQLSSILENKKLFEDLKKSHRWLEDQVEEKTEELYHSYDETLYILSKALELRDRETQGHTVRLAEITVELSKIFGINGYELENAKRGALLHDIGKMGIPDNILLKPGPLDEDEWKIMKKHPLFAKQLLENVSFLKPSLTIPYYHHERWDGSGYPEGLKGEDIPLQARVFAVLDTWDALTHDRPYRSAWSKHLALEYIVSNSGIKFDPEVVKKFLNFLKENNSYFNY